MAAAVVAALLDAGDTDLLRAVAAPAVAAIETSLVREKEVTAREARENEAFCADATIGTCTETPVKRVGVSGTRGQGHYGVNSVVYLVRHRGRPFALKALICAYGPFGAAQDEERGVAVREEMLQPPHSPHLLRYWAHFNGLIEGAVAEQWPEDVETTPRGSLTKWIIMPWVPDGNLQSWIRANPVADETTLLEMLRQLLHAVAALVQAGLLHRDIKLDNVLVRPTAGGGPPTLLLSDFGTLQSMENQRRARFAIPREGVKGPSFPPVSAPRRLTPPKFSIDPAMRHRCQAGKLQLHSALAL